MDVESVIAGVVVAVATVPAKPLAEVTDTLVTVPEPPPPLVATVQTLDTHVTSWPMAVR